MKKSKTLAFCLYAFLLSVFVPFSAQDANLQQIEMIDLKMNLAETKLDLLDSKIRLWEEKPAVLEMQLREIEKNIAQLTFSPEQFNEKFLLLDSLIDMQQSFMAEQSEIMASLPEELSRRETEMESDDLSEPVILPPYKYVISIYPVKLFEGTLQLSVERVLNRGNSMELSVMATYASKDGIANYYLSNQSLEYFSVIANDYIPYNSENISGLGGSLAWRNYLLPGSKAEYAAPRGLYVAPIVMYRRLTLSGFDQVYNEEEEINEIIEVTQKLNVFSGGFYAGWQFVLWKALTADVYVGGALRLSKYDGESKFTKYSQLQNIDFSGVMPSFGIKVGFVK
ncbi:MAG: hypothetical protein P1P86_11690 [Bacteroidales bacterium]|nr:hypothetical protein [Bacteroidales bacterium]